MLDNTQSIICAFGLASATPRSPYRHLELCGIAIKKKIKQKTNQKRSRCAAGTLFCARKVQSDKDRVKKSKNRLIIKLHAQNTCEKNLQNQNTQK
jgi:ribosomal 30S subunit maturation factor RimM